ncbi:mCG144853 [Mus musculus]|nr:mCG144853 [Mus musculus]
MKIHSPMAGSSETCSPSGSASCPLQLKNPASLWVDGFATGQSRSVNADASQSFKDILALPKGLRADVGSSVHLPQSCFVLCPVMVKDSLSVVWFKWRIRRNREVRCNVKTPSECHQRV